MAQIGSNECNLVICNLPLKETNFEREIVIRKHTKSSSHTIIIIDSLEFIEKIISFNETVISFYFYQQTIFLFKNRRCRNLPITDNCESLKSRTTLKILVAVTCNDPRDIQISAQKLFHSRVKPETFVLHTKERTYR